MKSFARKKVQDRKKCDMIEAKGAKEKGGFTHDTTGKKKRAFERNPIEKTGTPPF
nr:hypothetical protein [uncultured Anaerotignum sp.]